MDDLLTAIEDNKCIPLLEQEHVILWLPFGNTISTTLAKEYNCLLERGKVEFMTIEAINDLAPKRVLGTELKK